ncbi:MAG: phosphate ABC transporter permease PstA [Anaerolineaceae bacterium]
MDKKALSSARITQGLGFMLLRLIALLTVLPILGLVGYIIAKGAPALSWEFLTTMPSDGMRAGGIMPAIVGTLFLTLGTAVFSVPLGVAAGIYIAEYAADNMATRMIRIAIINLSGIPSVVYGLFGLGLFVIFLKFGTSILAASLTLSIMTLPVIISTTEEALRGVPNSFRVVSTSLGASRWQTVWRVTLPQGLPGIITGIILGLERAAGETAPILFTGASFFLPQLPKSVFDATMALPYHIFVISTQIPGMPVQIQYGSVLVLLIFVLGMNIAATIIRSRARARRQW